MLVIDLQLFLALLVGSGMSCGFRLGNPDEACRRNYMGIETRRMLRMAHIVLWGLSLTRGCFRL